MLNFMQQIEALLSQKKSHILFFFFAFPKCALNLEYFEKKDEYGSLVISKVFGSERGGYINV